MIVIVCVDDNNGTMFNRRRQTSDRVLRSKILELSAKSKLWMSHYSADGFDFSDMPEINVTDECRSEAQAGEYCFAEGFALLPYERWIEKIILFHWNRVYPADTYFDIPLADHGWKCVSREEFPGYSHERITMETYTK